VSRDPIHRLIEMMPWYDRETERKREARTEQIRQRSIALRIRVEGMTHEDLRGAYKAAGCRLGPK
jgi:hypothetical protein